MTYLLLVLHLTFVLCVLPVCVQTVETPHTPDPADALQETTESPTQQAATSQTAPVDEGMTATEPMPADNMGRDSALSVLFSVGAGTSRTSGIADRRNMRKGKRSQRGTSGTVGAVIRPHIPATQTVLASSANTPDPADALQETTESPTQQAATSQTAPADEGMTATEPVPADNMGRDSALTVPFSVGAGTSRTSGIADRRNIRKRKRSPFTPSTWTWGSNVLRETHEHEVSFRSSENALTDDATGALSNPVASQAMSSSLLPVHVPPGLSEVDPDRTLYAPPNPTAPVSPQWLNPNDTGARRGEPERDTSSRPPATVYDFRREIAPLKLSLRSKLDQGGSPLFVPMLHVEYGKTRNAQQQEQLLLLGRADPHHMRKRGLYQHAWFIFVVIFGVISFIIMWACVGVTLNLFLLHREQRKNITRAVLRTKKNRTIPKHPSAWQYQAPYLGSPVDSEMLLLSDFDSMSELETLSSSTSISLSGSVCRPKPRYPSKKRVLASKNIYYGRCLSISSTSSSDDERSAFRSKFSGVLNKNRDRSLRCKNTSQAFFKSYSRNPSPSSFSSSSRDVISESDASSAEPPQVRKRYLPRTKTAQRRHVIGLAQQYATQTPSYRVHQGLTFPAQIHGNI